MTAATPVVQVCRRCWWRQRVPAGLALRRVCPRCAERLWTEAPAALPDPDPDAPTPVVMPPDQPRLL